MGLMPKITRRAVVLFAPLLTPQVATYGIKDASSNKIFSSSSISRPAHTDITLYKIHKDCYSKILVVVIHMAEYFNTIIHFLHSYLVSFQQNSLFDGNGKILLY